jgi:hypothetical protein
VHSLRFFEWLYYPDIEPGKRLKPEVIDNIPKLKQKEQSIYKPTDRKTSNLMEILSSQMEDVIKATKTHTFFTYSEFVSTIRFLK